MTHSTRLETLGRTVRAASNEDEINERVDLEDQAERL
jgi:hypothetical protein